jgi:hypothetical protein
LAEVASTCGQTSIDATRCKLVAFVDDNERFLACMTPLTALSILRSPVMMEFANVINEGNAALFGYPGIVRKTLSTGTTNTEALRVMTDSNVETVVVTDEENRLKWIAEREQVLSRMVLALNPVT